MAGAFSAIGESRALATLVNAAGNFRLGLRDAAELSGQLLVRTTQSGMQSAGGGIKWPGSKRPAGVAGGYPAVQSGQLYGSLDYEVAGQHRLEFGSRGAFNRGYDYAIGQNEGNSRVQARPYLDLTVQKTQAQIERLLGETVYQKIIGGGG